VSGELHQTPTGFAVTSSADPAGGTIRAHIVATCWGGSMVLGELRWGEPDPSQAELDALAESIPISSGVRPNVRVIDVAFRRPPEVNPLDAA
jgi:hypothetical protein